MSNKNILQEYCQQNKIKLPSYETILTGSQLDIEWTATVIFGGKKYIASAKSKTTAEQTVAGTIIKDLKIPKQNQVQNCQSPQIIRRQKVDSVYDIDFKKYKTIFLIDSENCELIDQDIDKYPNALFIFFCAKNNTKTYCFKMQENRPNAYVFISQSIGRDAADHLLSYIFGIIQCIDNFNKISHFFYILTKDHYGECLEKFSDNIKHICDMNEI